MKLPVILFLIINEYNNNSNLPCMWIEIYGKTIAMRKFRDRLFVSYKAKYAHLHIAVCFTSGSTA